MKTSIHALILALLAMPAFADVRGVALTIDGSPVAGARVDVSPYEGHREAILRVMAGKQLEPIPSVRTDAKGNFVVPVKTTGDYTLAVTADGFAPSVVPTTGAEDLGGILLRRAAMKSGQVTAAGKPVAGAIVLLRSLVSVELRTDDQGRFTVPDPKVWYPSIAVIAPNYALHRRQSDGLGGEPARLDVRLMPGTTLRGKVLAIDGKSGAKATLQVDGIPAGESAEDGSFAIQNVPLDWQELRATSGDLVASAGRTNFGSMRLAKATHYSGAFVDAKTRTPVGGVVISLSSENASYPFGEVRTNVKGTYSFAVLPGTYWISAAHAGYGSLNGARFVTATSVPRNTYLKHEVRITGVVMNPARAPVAAARVQGTLPDGRRTPGDALLVSAPDGRFLVRVPASLYDAGALDFIASRSGWAVAKDGPHTLKDGDAKRIDFTLTRGATLTGRVTDADGAALAGVAIGAQEMPRSNMSLPYNVDWSELPVTDREGAFSILLRPATYTMRFYLAGYAARAIRDVAVDENAGPLEVKLERAVSISGRVVNAEGEAVRDLPVTASVPGPAVTTRTDETGAFTVSGLPADLVTLYFEAQDGSVSEDRAIKAPAENVIVKLAPTITISGKVVAKGGAPVKDFSLGITPPEQSGNYQGASGRSGDFHDAGGKFILEGVTVRPSDLEVTAAGFQGARVSLRIEEGKDIDDLEITLERAATLRGRVTTRTGTPVERAAVSVRGAGAGEGQRLARAVTDADGEFVIEDAPPGGSILTVLKRAFPTLTRNVEIANEGTYVDIQMETGKTISGRVVTASGTPVAEVEVTAFTQSPGGGFVRTNSDAAGRFVLEGLTPTIYGVMATKRGYTTFSKKDFDAAIASELSITLVTGATITGTILGLDPKAFKDVVVQATASGSWAPGKVDSSGSFKIEGAPIGSVTVLATTRGRTNRTSEEATVQTEAGGTHKVDLEFKEHNTLTGRITRHGSAVTAGYVSFLSQAGRRAGGGGAIDASGHYEAIGIADGEFLVQITDSNTNTRYAVPRTVTHSQTLDIDINPATLDASVVDATTDQPLANVDIVMEPTKAAEGFAFMTLRGRTGADGRAVIENIAPGTYNLRASREGYGTRLETKTAYEGSRIELAARLEPSSGSTLRLIDPRNGGLTTAWISASANGQVVYTGRPSAKSDGSVVVPLPPGSYRVNVLSAALASTYVTVTAPGSQDITLRLPGTLEIVGNAPNARVRFVTADGAEYNIAPAGTGGAIGLPPGAILPNFAAGAYVMQVLGSDNSVTKSYSFEIREGQTTKLQM